MRRVTHSTAWRYVLRSAFLVFAVASFRTLRHNKIATLANLTSRTSTVTCFVLRVASCSTLDRITASHSESPGHVCSTLCVQRVPTGLRRVKQLNSMWKLTYAKSGKCKCSSLRRRRSAAHLAATCCSNIYCKRNLIVAYTIWQFLSRCNTHTRMYQSIGISSFFAVGQSVYEIFNKALSIAPKAHTKCRLIFVTQQQQQQHEKQQWVK